MFYQHCLVLATFMFLLCKDIITTAGLQKGERLVDFVKQFETLYGNINVSFNVHLCLHLPESVRNWQPLWAHSGYISESYNGEILKMFHGTQCVPLQTMKQFTYRQVLPLLRNNALTNSVPECIQFFSQLTGKKRMKQLNRVGDQFVTIGLHYSQELSSEERLVMKEQLAVTTGTAVKISKRVLVSGELHYYVQFTRVMKRNNCTDAEWKHHCILLHCCRASR